MTEVITRAQHELMRQGAENLALRVKLADAELNEERYRKLRAWLVVNRRIILVPADLTSEESVDAAVDALPEPESAEQKEEIA